MAGTCHGERMVGVRRPRSLVELIQRDLERDPGDAPAVYLEAAVMADDMARMPTAEEPRPSDPVGR